MDHIGESSDPSSQSSLPFRIESREDPVGRYLVASRDIKAGEVVFREKQPLAVGPNPLSQPQCINCHVKVTTFKWKYHVPTRFIKFHFLDYVNSKLICIPSNCALMTADSLIRVRAHHPPKLDCTG